MTSYRTQVNVKMELSKAEFLEGIGVLVEGEAKQLCPTGVTVGDHQAGTLKRSITHEVNEAEEYVAIGVPEDTEAGEYAGAVEEGIGQPKQAYLEPGAVNSIPHFQDVAYKHYNHNLGGL